MSGFCVVSYVFTNISEALNAYIIRVTTQKRVVFILKDVRNSDIVEILRTLNGGY